MAGDQIKITELPGTTVLNNADIFPMVQIFGASQITKKISWSTLKTLILGIIGPTEITGVIKEYGGTVLPSGYLWCNGQAVSRTTYAALFTAIGTTHGSGNGSTTFNVPNKMGVVTIGREGMGGVASSGRITSASTGGSNAGVLGATGGSQTHTLTDAQMPAHSHDYETPASYAASVGSGGTSGVARVQTTGTTTSSGSGDPHNNTQPWVAGNFIIKT